MRKRTVLFGLCLIVTSWLAAPAGLAVEKNLTEDQVNSAMAQGRKAGAEGNLKTLFAGYSFGRLGEVNGYVLTKFFEVRFLAAAAAKTGTELDRREVRKVLRKDYLQFPVFLSGGDKAQFQAAKVTLKQGDHLILPSRTLRDQPRRECDATRDNCNYFGNIFPSFLYDALDLGAKTVVTIEYKDSTWTFEVDLGSMK